MRNMCSRKCMQKTVVHTVLSTSAITPFLTIKLHNMHIIRLDIQNFKIIA